MSEELLKTAGGTPYATETAAKTAQTIHKKSGVDSEVVQIEGGWALKTTEEPKPETTEAPKNVERIPLGTTQLKLQVPKEMIPKGKIGRWINDTGSRIFIAQRGGYNFVEDSSGMFKSQSEAMDNRIVKTVGKHEDGSPMRAYLMAIDEALYRADQEAKQKEIDVVDQQILNGNLKPVEGGYVPSSGISFKRE